MELLKGHLTQYEWQKLRKCTKLLFLVKESLLKFKPANTQIYSRINFSDGLLVFLFSNKFSFILVMQLVL